MAEHAHPHAHPHANSQASEHVEIDLPLFKGKPLTLNQNHDRFARAAIVKQIRTSVGWQAKALKLDTHDHITVRLHYRPGDKRRRDTDNLVASQKPAVDGLVDAKVVPDDDPKHLTWWAPVIHTDPGKRRLWLEIAPSRSIYPENPS